MTIVRAPEKDWTKDGRKYYFVVSYKNALGERKKYHSKKITQMEEIYHGI